MKTMMKSFIASFFTIAFSIPIIKKQKFSKKLLSLLVAILANVVSLPVLANSVEIIRATPDNERVILKVRVIDNQRNPLQELNSEDFEIKTTDANETKLKFSLKTPQIELTPPEKTKPDPAYLIILLDMSGSMRNPDNSGQIKLQGAMNGIQAFIKKLKTEKLPVEIALVPFGEKGERCNNIYPVNQEIIKNSLDATPYEKTEERLEQLSGINPCAATNLYQPLDEAVEFLGTEERFKADSSKLPPRLGVILFTDGFDVYRSDEPQRFQNLLNLLAKYPQVTVHTMGYGESLSQLRDRADCYPYYLSNQSLTVDNLLKCRLKGQDIKEFIVDENRLTQIAQTTKFGIAKFPKDSQEVSDSLKTFLTTLREYEITYQQPGADRASSHQTQVIVNAPDQGLNNLPSKLINIQMDNFFYHSLSSLERLVIFIVMIIVSVGGIIRFNNWSKQLKEQSKL